MTEENKGERNVEHVSSIKERLQHVANEIDTIKNSFSKSTEDLSRIQNMLDVGGLEEISGVIEQFEGQLSEAEKKREEAAEGARKYSEELEKEKERLIKLWDAYKNQEEELSNTEKRISDYEERARVAEVSKKQLEDDLTARMNTLTQKLAENEGKINQFDEYKQRCEEFDNIRNQLEEETRVLKDQIYAKDNTVNSLQHEVEELKKQGNYAEYKEKFEEVSVQYEKEKERLTKLYHLYEETETECKVLREETKSWQDWFDSNKDIFNRLFAGAPPTSTAVPLPPDDVPITPPTNPTEKKSKRKAKKRKLKLRK